MSQNPAEVPSEPVAIEDESHLEEVVSEYDVVLVDFYADWCGPCKMIEPVLEGLARETDAAIAKVDVDQHQILAGQMGVQGVPTLLLYADGAQVERVVGVQPAERLKAMIENHSE
ncbi:thioredoxin [Natronobeatus ordinarius]|uniref:thioredoxin n=1 Tax=Natronobeatus ordinarius TaxID=2963433 RepID=UPI0020CEE8EE|nr:thioredoxin [Natronobeatus ordinarius]